MKKLIKMKQIQKICKTVKMIVIAVVDVVVNL